MSEVSVKTESDIGSSIYSLTTYTNQSGSYFVNVSAFTSNGVTVGYMIQNVFAPAGKYSFNLTSLSGENYKV
ncbi:hypothetical protein KEJ45_06185 [Candidatus Bathyarchaeota archaeon]|nr:hypothetical protein [Candidatus Bathyarchaeota archaeon]